MIKQKCVLVLFLCSMSLAGGVALADNHSEAAMDEHQGHGDMASAQNQGKGTGTLHSIDADSGKVNLTHAPIPELNWNQMTMDLPVTKRVDLSKFKADDKVKFTIKKGRDNRFRITEMSLQSDE